MSIWPRESTVDPEKVDWDVVIVGTGMGGGTLGLELARAGRRILWIERGRSHLHRDQPEKAIFGETVERHAQRMGWNDRARKAALALGGRNRDVFEDVTKAKPKRFIPDLGSGTGGSSALYGMVLERLFPADFHPRGNHPDAGDATLPEAWPIGYEEFRPWYEAAERLYRVRGTADPLRPDEAVSLMPPPPLTEHNRELFEYLEGAGLHPYQLHLACEHLPECGNCQGFLCPAACRNDAARMCVGPALAHHHATLLTECRAVSIEASRTRAEAVVCRWEGRDIRVRGRTIVLAAGATATPALLLNSRSKDWPRGLANDSGMVGQNLMRHFIDLFVLFPKNKKPIEGQTKELALNDFYHRGDQKLGTVQSIGPMPPFADVLYKAGPDRLLFKILGPLFRRVWDRVRPRVIVMAGILEDLPYADNRVLPPDAAPTGEEDPRAKIEYRVRSRDLERVKAFRSEIKRRMGPYRALPVGVAEDNKVIAHCCGTCRFGADPKTSVLDPGNRAHGLDNLYVVDGSFFPSSGGINPSLTIAANALRVANLLKERC